VTNHEKFLPYARQLIDDKDIEAVNQVLRSEYLTTGPVVKTFEKKLAQVTGVPFAIACSSGTAALHLASMALGLTSGDSVIVPSITFLATANAVRYVDAEVIFADVDAFSGLMGPEHLEKAIKENGENIKAVFPVHLGGQSPDMEAIFDIAKKNDLYVVEDASHAIGASYSTSNGMVKVGGCVHSDMTTFSCHPVKTITMGEGGAVTTKNQNLAEKLWRLLNHGINREPSEFIYNDLALDSTTENGMVNPWYYEMHYLGFNYRVSDIHCALGLSQLKKLSAFVEGRRALVRRYDEKLASLAPLLSPVTRISGNDPSWHLYQLLLDFEKLEISRSIVMKRLRERGIGTQVHYIPVHCQPYYRQRYGSQILCGAESFYKCCLSLPLFSGMRETDIDIVVNAINKTLGIENKR